MPDVTWTLNNLGIIEPRQWVEQFGTVLPTSCSSILSSCPAHGVWTGGARMRSCKVSERNENRKEKNEEKKKKNYIFGCNGNENVTLLYFVQERNRGNFVSVWMASAGISGLISIPMQQGGILPSIRWHKIAFRLAGAPSPSADWLPASTLSSPISIGAGMSSPRDKLPRASGCDADVAASLICSSLFIYC